MFPRDADGFAKRSVNLSLVGTKGFLDISRAVRVLLRREVDLADVPYVSNNYRGDAVIVTVSMLVWVAGT